MKRDFNFLKRREGKELPPEKLYENFSKIYPEETTTELMDKLVKPAKHPTKKGGEK